MKLTIRDKLFYMAQKLDKNTLCGIMHVSMNTLNEIIRNPESSTGHFKDRLKREFNFQIQEDVKYEADKYAKKLSSIKNYDDEDLEDLKTYNSRHGVNKNHRSHSGHSN